VRRARSAMIFLFGAIILSIALEALGYANDQTLGDMSIWAMFGTTLFASVVVGLACKRDTAWVAALAGVGCANIILATNLHFLGAYRVTMLNNFNASSWSDFSRVYSAVGILVAVLCAAIAFALAWRKSKPANDVHPARQQ
jgi:hypothetical protein